MHTKNHSKKSQSRRRNWELRRQRREEKQAAHPIRSALPFLGITGVVMAAAITAASCAAVCYVITGIAQAFLGANGSLFTSLILLAVAIAVELVVLSVIRVRTNKKAAE